jgi:hypothetical protein
VAINYVSLTMTALFFGKNKDVQKGMGAGHDTSTIF